MVDEYGMTKFDRSFFKKAFAAVLIIAFVATMSTIYLNNRWKRDLGVAYVGTVYEPGTYSVSYYEYEITNKTNRKLENVVLTIEVKDSILDSKTKCQEHIGDLREGEIEAIKIYKNRLEREMEDAGEYFVYYDFSIKRITYQ